MKKNITFLGLFLLSFVLFAQPKAGYYNNAVGKTEAALKTQLYSIISTGYVYNDYDYLYTIYQTSDVTSTGNLWDMYSTCTWTLGVKQCGNVGTTTCVCYNREHSIPQSWFGEASPMRSDAFHVYPTDGKVNGQRSNYPYGECANGTTLSGGKGRLGSSTFAGYSGTVFEPVDEYKGDFARTYFYFATRYQNIMTTIGGESFNKSTYPSLSTWSQNLFLKWHRQDPVSQKEIVRNNAIEVHQKNRNPFIDYPELVEHIWGTKKGLAWSFTSGVDELKIDFSVSPNPASSVLTVNTDEQNIDYTVFNLNGQTLMQNNLDVQRTISIEQLENGMYLLQLTSGNRKTIQKFIVNK
jgi:endonuclease I